MVQDTLEVVRRKAGETIKRRLRTGDVHTLGNAPIEARALLALLGYQRFHAITIASVEQRDETLILARRHLLQGHVQAPIRRRKRNHVSNPRLESRRPKRQVSSAGRTKPVHFA